MYLVHHTQGYPAASLNRRFADSPIDALIDFAVRCRLRRQIPVQLDLRPVIHLRITVVPQRRPACGDYARGLGVDTDVVQNLPYLRTLGNERIRALVGSLETALTTKLGGVPVAAHSERQVGPAPLS